MSSPARKPRVVEGTTGEHTDPDCMELFRVDGVSYTIPRQVPANVFLRYLWEARHRGVDVALMGLLENMVGARGMRALLDHDGLEDDTLTEILRGLTRMIEGRVDISGN